MKKNDVFTFTDPNGEKVTAVVVDYLGTINVEQGTDYTYWEDKYLCYAQDKLFYLIEETKIDKVIDDDFVPSCDEENDLYYAITYHSHDVKTTSYSQKILVDYCVLPDYDALLERYNDIEVAQTETNLGM